MPPQPPQNSRVTVFFVSLQKPREGERERNALQSQNQYLFSAAAKHDSIFSCRDRSVFASPLRFAFVRSATAARPICLFMSSYEALRPSPPLQSSPQFPLFSSSSSSPFDCRGPVAEFDRNFLSPLPLSSQLQSARKERAESAAMTFCSSFINSGKSESVVEFLPPRPPFSTPLIIAASASERSGWFLCGLMRRRRSLSRLKGGFHFVSTRFSTFILDSHEKKSFTKGRRSTVRVGRDERTRFFYCGTKSSTCAYYDLVSPLWI